MNIQEAYLILHKASGLKVGDKVRIVRSFEKNEHGVSQGWDAEMEECIGKEGEIARDLDEKGFRVMCPRSWVWPFYCLERVAPEPILINGDVVEFGEDGLQVGHVHVPKETLQAIYDRAQEVWDEE